MFWHWLASKLGGTVEELQHRMTSLEFSNWIRIAEKHGWGFQLEDHRMGVLASTIANYSGMMRSRSDMRKPTDYYSVRP